MTDQTEVNLPGTIAGFQAAIHALAGRTRDTIVRDGGTIEPVWGDPLYRQIVDAVARSGGAGASGTLRQSMAPAVIDLIDLTDQIDRTVRGWVTFDRPAGHGTTGIAPDTIALLHALEDETWRPQDVPQLIGWTQDLIWWRVRAQELLDPPRRWTLPSPCPACKTTTVYRQDSANETVRQPALQITTEGCECQKCHTYWPPENFGILAGAIKTNKDETA